MEITAYIKFVKHQTNRTHNFDLKIGILLRWQQSILILYETFKICTNEKQPVCYFASNNTQLFSTNELHLETKLLNEQTNVIDNISCHYHPTILNMEDTEKGNVTSATFEHMKDVNLLS